MTDLRRVAVTGIGMVTPLGHSTEATWDALMQQKSGIAKIASFDASHFPTQIAAEVKNFNPLEHISEKRHMKYSGSFTRFALAAAEQAFQDAGTRPTESTNTRWGLVAGSGMMTAEYDYWLRFQETMAKNGEVDYAHLGDPNNHFFAAADFAGTQPNTGVALLSSAYDIRGYTSSVHTACASGGQALALAMRAIQRGDADSILAGGFDSMINPFGLADFCLLGALSTRNDEPEKASRPFDLERNGFVLGEGAAFIILEAWDKAVARKARIYAEFAGEGNTLSAYRITDSHPSGDGARQAIQMALDTAGETIDSVDYINAHGTSTKMNDFSETNAIKAVFKEKAKDIPCSSTKSQTGHLIAAAGALEAALSVMSIHTGKIPMTANRTTPDPDCDLDYVVEGPRNREVNVAISNSFGFGGSNSCLLFKSPDGGAA